MISKNFSSLAPPFRASACKDPYPSGRWGFITLAFVHLRRHHGPLGIQEDIERVEQHIREIEQRIERQRGVITQAEESGLPTDGPRNFLWFLKETRSLSRDHLARLLADEFRAKDSQ